MSICIILFRIAKVQIDRADAAEELVAAHKAMEQALQDRARLLREALMLINKTGEEADHEKEELVRMSDADLVHRANTLFRMPNCSAKT
jgi:predicted  nucleic acid-binding Zn-ribbon protein